MPLKSGKSEQVVAANIKTEMKSGRPQAQAVAIVMRKAHDQIHAHHKAQGDHYTQTKPSK